MKLRKLLKHIDDNEEIKIVAPDSSARCRQVGRLASSGSEILELQAGLIWADAEGLCVGLQDPLIVCELCIRRFRCSHEEAVLCAKEDRKNWIPNF